MSNRTRFPDLLIALALVAPGAIARAEPPPSQQPSQEPGQQPSQEPGQQAGQAGETPEFLHEREVRVKSLGAELSIFATEPALISAFAQAEPLTAEGQAQVKEKLSAFEIQLDRTSTLLQGLANAEPSVWNERNSVVTDSMDRLRDARNQAWEALQNAPRAGAAS